MYCDLSFHIYLYHQFTGIDQNRNRNVVGYKGIETFLAVLAAVRHSYGALLYVLVDCCRGPVKSEGMDYCVLACLAFKNLQ